MNRCYGCFEPIADSTGRCKHCGFANSEYSVPKWVLQPGTILNGKYLIGKRLGEGGFGITYLAWDVNMETKVAIKEYYPGYLVSRDVTSVNGNVVTTTAEDENDDYQVGLKRYVKEASVLSRFFELPGIVSVKDFFYENETAYIVMEYIDGVSLKKYLEQKGGKVSADEALKLVEPVISSLAVVHKNKLLHRDISPDNIMLDKNGRVKLIDFGAARYFGNESDKSMTVMLKHGYAPIEQYSRNGDQSSVTDVYALCAVLYRMITGVVPVDASDRVHNDTFVPVRSLAKKTPKYIAAAIEKGLSVFSENRQQSMEELYSELYVSKSGRISRGVGKVTDKIYSIVKKILIALIIILVLIVGAGIVYRLNIDTFKEYKEKVEYIFGIDNEDEDSFLEDKSTKNNVSEQPKEEAEDTESEKDDEVKDKEIKEEVPAEEEIKETIEAATVQPAVEEEAAVAIDPRIEHGIIVARDGCLNGRAQTLTVGNILDSYSDVLGTWDGYVDDSGQIFVYYQGIKNGVGFAFEFQIFENDSFKLTGAAQNGEQIETYSDFFQQILDEVGV